MLGPFDIFIWLVGFTAQSLLLVYSFKYGLFRSYPCLTFYILALTIDEILHFCVLQRYGFSSWQYEFVYLYTDVVNDLFKFTAIVELYLHAFREVHVAKRIRIAALTALTATILCTLFVVATKHQSFGKTFALEFSEILYFVTAGFIYLLWILVIKRRDPNLFLAFVVSCLGFYSSAQAVLYGFLRAVPAFAPMRYTPAILGAWLPISLLYGITHVHKRSRVSADYLQGRLSQC